MPLSERDWSGLICLDLGPDAATPLAPGGPRTEETIPYSTYLPWTDICRRKS